MFNNNAEPTLIPTNYDEADQFVSDCVAGGNGKGGIYTMGCQCSSKARLTVFPDADERVRRAEFTFWKAKLEDFVSPGAFPKEIDGFLDCQGDVYRHWRGIVPGTNTMGGGRPYRIGRRCG